MPRANRLLAVQEIDSLRDRSRARMARIEKALSDHPAVNAAQQALERANDQLAALEPKYRSAARERDEAKAHLEREQSKLYSGAVKVPKELQGLQRETEALKRQLAERDDRLLETMLERDDAAEAVAAAMAALDTATAKARADSSTLGRERDRLAAELRELDARRAHVVAGVPAADLELYERLRKAKGGTAVSRLTNGECDACGMQLPRQQADQAQSSHGIVYCPTCGRILAA